MIRRIFIVGTGRSGTWITYHALGSHKSVHAFPREMRFLIDPDGLRDLVDGLTTKYHPVQAREALYRFERLLRTYMTTPERGPYKGFQMAEWIGVPYYWDRLEEFCAELEDFRFEGSAWQVEPELEGRMMTTAKRLTVLRQQISGQPTVPFRLTLPRNGLKSVKYFSDRSDLISRSAAFVDDLFLHAATKNGKKTWCEKTPQNLLALDFIWELFPDSLIIHIKRDPRGVVQSMTKQFWAPSDLARACEFLKPVYHAWQVLSGKLDLSRENYLEFRLEDFADTPRPYLSKIAQAAGIEDQFDNLPDISIDRVDYWKSSMSREDIALINSSLGSEIKSMGYHI